MSLFLFFNIIYLLFLFTVSLITFITSFKVYILTSLIEYKISPSFITSFFLIVEPDNILDIITLEVLLNLILFAKNKSKKLSLNILT